jgi:hypothetical protein
MVMVGRVERRGIRDVIADVSSPSRLGRGPFLTGAFSSAAGPELRFVACRAASVLGPAKGSNPEPQQTRPAVHSPGGINRGPAMGPGPASLLGVLVPTLGGAGNQEAAQAPNRDSSHRRRASRPPEPVHREIYRALQIPYEVMKPVRTWSDPRA